MNTQKTNYNTRGAQDPDTPEEGSTTVEYAIGVVVAATLAGLMLTIVKSDAVRQALENIVQQALTVV